MGLQVRWDQQVQRLRMVRFHLEVRSRLGVLLVPGVPQVRMVREGREGKGDREEGRAASEEPEDKAAGKVKDETVYNKNRHYHYCSDCNCRYYLS